MFKTLANKSSPVALALAEKKLATIEKREIETEPSVTKWNAKKELQEMRERRPRGAVEGSAVRKRERPRARPAIQLARASISTGREKSGVRSQDHTLR
jgi:hypothetical protein